MRGWGLLHLSGLRASSRSIRRDRRALPRLWAPVSGSAARNAARAWEAGRGGTGRGGAGGAGPAPGQRASAAHPSQRGLEPRGFRPIPSRDVLRAGPSRLSVLVGLQGLAGLGGAWRGWQAGSTGGRSRKARGGTKVRARVQEARSPPPPSPSPTLAARGRGALEQHRAEQSAPGLRRRGTRVWRGCGVP